jgi:ankyrin repeat protein
MNKDIIRDILRKELKSNKKIYIVDYKNYGSSGDLSDNDLLLVACIYGHLAIVKYFVEWQIDVNVINNYDDTPLLLAINYGHIKIIKYLIKHGCNFGDDKNGNYVINVILEERYNEAECMIDNGYNVNTMDDTNYTTLMAAVHMNNVELVKKLLEKGCHVNIKHDKKIALYHAIDSCDYELVKLLIDYGADITHPSIEFDHTILSIYENYDYVHMGELNTFKNIFNYINYIQKFKTGYKNMIGERPLKNFELNKDILITLLLISNSTENIIPPEIIKYHIIPLLFT